LLRNHQKLQRELRRMHDMGKHSLNDLAELFFNFPSNGLLHAHSHCEVTRRE
jgi:hypothetical protein